MKIYYRYLIISAIGGAAYCTLEMLWRGRTHYSMLFAGALAAALFYYINETFEMNRWLKCLAGMLTITAIELTFGLVFNILLRQHVWDYSGIILNFYGQICLPYCFLWFILSGVAFSLIDKINALLLKKANKSS